MDAILLRPGNDLLDTSYDHAESLGIGYLASFARENGYNVKIIDAVVENKHEDQLVEEIKLLDPKILGISVLFVSFKNVISLVSKLRSKGYNGHITLGGHYPTFDYKSILCKNPEIDSIIRFEGEYPFLELLNSLVNYDDKKNISNLVYWEDGKIHENELRALIDNLDHLPFPARDLLPIVLETNPSISLSGSRGCWEKCKFCTVTSFYGKARGPNWRGRSVKSLLDEIEFLADRYRCHSFTFIDDNFIGPGARGIERIFEFCSEIESRKLQIKFSIECRPDRIKKDLFGKLKSVGLKSVFLGIETANESCLKKWEKNISIQKVKSAIEILHDLDINLIAGFMMFHPDSTLVEIEANIDFISRYQFFEFPALFRRVEVRHGMQLYEELEDRGLLNNENGTAGYNFIENDVAILYNVILQSFSKLATLYFKIREAKRNGTFSFELYRIFNAKLCHNGCEIMRNLIHDIRGGKNKNYLEKEVEQYISSAYGHIEETFTLAVKLQHLENNDAKDNFKIA